MKVNRKSVMKTIAGSAIGILLASAAIADPLTVLITGKVLAGACTVDNSGVYNVKMEDVSAGTLNTANSYGEWKNFDVTLSNCPAQASSMTATFSGTQDSQDPTKYANKTGTGYSSNVSVQLQDRTDGTDDKGNGSTMETPIDANKVATFKLAARPYSTAGHATVGKISTTVVMNFTYN